MKSLLIIGESPYRKFKNNLIKYFPNHHQVNDIKNLEKIYIKNKFDICIIFDNYKIKTFQEILDQILKKNKKQKILILQTKNSHNCYNTNNCKFCNQENNIITLKEPFNTDYVVNLLENFSSFLCHSLIKSHKNETLRFLEDFSSLDDFVLESLITISKIQFYESKTVISYSDKNEDKIFYLISGCIRRFIGGKNLKNITIQTICQPKFLIDTPTLQFQNISSGIESLGEVYILEFDRKEFFKLIATNPNLMLLVTQSMMKELENYKYIIWKQLAHDSLERLCLELVKNENILQYKNKGELSEELNMAQETLSRSIRKLKDENILNDSLNIIDKKLLYTFLEKNY